MTNKFMSLESTIRSLGAKSASQPMEKDMNDQVHAGSYTSKNFEVSKPAQKLFADLPKHIDSDDAEESLKLHDKLFGIHKKVKATGRATSADIIAARSLHDQILKIGRTMGIEDKHKHVKDSLDFIKSNLDTEGNAQTDVDANDVAKRFASPPKDYQSDVKSDSDIDNMAKFHISRDKRAQRKLKIIDDEFKPGESAMSKMLDAMKQVVANEEELEEKKLVGKQKKLDKNHNGKLDAEDFKKLRKEEAEELDELKKSALQAVRNRAHGNLMDNPSDEKSHKVEKQASSRLKKITDKENDERSKREYAAWKEEVEQIDEVSKKTLKSYLKKADDDAVGAYLDRDTKRRNKRQAGMRRAKDRLSGHMLTKKKYSTEEVEQIDEAQFVVITKGSERKRIRNNPIEIARARKERWAINESNEMQNLAKSQAKAVIKREVQQKKAMFAKKDSTDKSKFAKSMQKIHAGDEVNMDKKAVFMERAISILGEEFADMSYEQLAEEIAKRGRGRPRKHPVPDANAPKRGRGRPKKGAAPASTSTSSSEKKPEEAGDREHILMALRKSVSLRGQHHVKFANGETHQIPAEHAAKAMRIHDSLSKPSEKMVFQRKLGASHDSFKKALQDKNPGSEETKKSGITLAKRAD